MKQTIRHIILFLTLIIGCVGNAWAITESDIIINILPNDAAGTVSVTDISGMKVTISATPASGYSIDATHVIAEKMVDPQVKALLFAPGISSKLDITDNGGNSFSFTIPEGYTGAYVTVNFYNATPNGITSLDQITDLAGTYVLTTDVDASGFNGLGEFTGTLDGGLYKVYNLSKPLFASTDGAIIRNLIFEDVNISSGDNDGDAGVVTSKAKGETRIYNCGILPTSAERDNEGNITGFYGSSVSGSRYVGGLVGLLDGSSRVINCYSYANVFGGTYVGGIVGYNNVATTATNLKTMVMNCMFYGEVSGSSIAPIYNGKIITNVGANTGVGNYNYFRLESSYIQNTAITKVYNCALGAETRFLQRFEFFRHLLNSHRELAAWWATGSMANKDEMMKWVLEPTQISSSAPFPILKTPGYYPSVVNIDAENAPTTTERNKGGKLGTLSVTIQSGSGAVFGAPTGASITKSSLTLNITDKDPDHFNFNYYKVQLPYYNDVGTGNYTGNRVVTGWKIVSITGGTPGEFSTSTADAPSFNFADRHCTNKDLYSVSGRVFNQGAYWDVPEGVTAITIQPYWAKAAYVSDAYPDVVYSTDMKTAYNVPNVGGGEKYTNNTNYNIADEQQKVYTSVGNAASALSPDASHTVHDYAVVLVGNVHQYTTNNSAIGNNKNYTVTTIDLDHDNEPDYSLMLRNDGRNKLHPVKWDFLNIVGLGMAQKSTGGTGSYNQGIFQPLYWFESTNTSLFRVTQFEYDNNDRIEAPYIVQGGVMEQWVSGQSGGAANKTTYFHVGGNVWFKEFHRGTHQDKDLQSNHPPVSVTGGDYNEFYLTGLYTANVTSYADNAECYINGGRFGVVAGAAMEGIGKPNGADDTGNITWQVQNADIREFFAGGINAAKPVTGNLSTTITGGKIDLFCGGPKFGDMSTGKTVTTNATDCIFGTFFGAGYGGNSYSRQAPRNHNNIVNFPHNDKDAGNDESWNSWLGRFYTQTYSSTYGGVSTQFNYQFLPMSQNADNCARIFVEYVKFSLATCRNVTSTLSGCKITGNFYGGGSLGKVDGPVTSTLTNCEVQGSAFGAGFSASLPSVEVDDRGFTTEPYYYKDLGTYREGVKGATTTYTWQKKTGNSWVDNTNHILYTSEDLTTLGAVTGKATLTINGTTTVGESVYGGGEESGVGGDTEVNVYRGTIGTPGYGGVEYGNVFGGGKGKVGDKVAGYVKGNTTVNISQASAEEPTTIYHNVYGGGAYGSVGDFTYDPTSGMPTALATANTGNTTVTITGGTFGSNGHENGMVFGSSRGDVATPEGDPAVDPNDRMAWVYSTHVTIGDAGAATSPTIKGSVYGSGENGHTFQNTIVDIKKGIVGITDTNIDGGAAYVYRGNVYGGGCGTDKYDSNSDGIKDKYNPLAGIVKGTTTVNITGGQVVHNVYGAGAMGSVGGGAEANSGKTTINISGGRIGYDGNGNGHIFGAARGEYGVSTAASGLANVRETAVNINYTTTPAADNDGKTVQLIAGSVFGGGEAGTVKESVAVNMTGGLILKDVYGGGALADTQTSNWDATANENAGGWTDADKKSALHTTTVRLTGGHVGEEVFGGGLGEADKPAYVWGDVLVDLNGTTTSGTTGSPIADDAKGCVVGQIFGCNNINGTPKGDVMVHVYATQSLNKADISTKPDKNTNTYDVTAVYGGGNQAAYNPVVSNTADTSESETLPNGSRIQVIIEGCTLTSINTVYGGGNAAAVPETNVDIKGAYEIGYLFGGGNGKDDIAPGVPNPGADVGTPDHGTTTYGTGNANTLMEGGLIHEAYGGSNTKGIIKGSINQITDPKDPESPAYCCDLEVEKIVGAGKYADIDGDVNMTLSCQPSKKVDLLFAGADEAHVNGNITLNITNGHFGKVFGGNNLGGAIKGKITVNVEETGCQPIKIDDLYLGSNEAAYSVFGYYESEEIHPVTGNKILKPRTSADDSHTPVDNPATDETHTFPYKQPELNIISCTYIGNVFGGGLGAPAKMYANPTVNVNLEPGDYAETAVPAMMTELELDASKNPHKLGIIRNIYGGGDAANIEGNTTVNIATKAERGAYIIGNVFGAGKGASDNVASAFVSGNTEVNICTADYSEETGKGVYIAESVYGGGQLSQVGGNTNITVSGGTIGTTGNGGATYGNVYGGGFGNEDNVEFGLVKGNTNIAITKGNILHNVYGGGAFGSVGTFTYNNTTGFPNSCADNTGVATITITGGTFGSNGKDNGMVFGSSRGSEGDPALDANVDKMAWVGSTNVIIGTQSETPDLDNPIIKGSVYGGGENGHNYKDGHVTVHNGTIGITDPETDGGARYPTRGNVYGAGCGTDTFERGEGDNKKTYYDFHAGIVMGNTQVDIDGGHIVHNVYGGGAMGSVGTYTFDANGKPVSCAENTGLCTVNITGGKIGMTNASMTGHGTDGPDDFGHVFGAGRGYSKDPDLYPNIESSAFFNNTALNISGSAFICGSVYGGSESGHVLHNTSVNMSGGQIGCAIDRVTPYTDDDFTNQATLYGTNHWTYTPGDTGAPYDQYADTPGYDAKGGATVGTDGRTFYGNVFAGGSGYYPYAPGKWLRSAGHIGGTASVTLSGGHILNNLYGGCEMADIDGAVTVTMTGGTVGVPRHHEVIAENPNYGNVYGAGMGDKRIFFNTSTNVASTTINISNGTVYGSVYGGGEDGHVMGNATTTISQPEDNKTVIGCNGQSGYDGNVFGAGQGHVGALTAGVVGGNASLTITGGTLKGSAYGGGRIASVGTYFASADDPKYGKMQDGDDHGNLSVSLTGGTISQNVYGGCMGTAGDIAYGVSKNVSVELNKDVEDDAKGCIVLGPIFGCNNVNSSPEGTSTVHIYKTQRNGASRITNTAEVTDAKVNGTKDSEGEFDLSSFDVPAVYGGGNLAAYTPKAENGSTNVIIDGCERTSVGQVYGGGNAASTPATSVTVNGTFEIGELFGGGNGKDAIAPGVPNPGANVGFYTYDDDADDAQTPEDRAANYGYGSGQASVNIYGGTIHRVFGGSNTKGNVRKTAVTMLEEVTDGGLPVCEFHVDEAYGGGKSALMDAQAKLLMACIPGLEEVYGGAQAADIHDDVMLTITNGTFNRVFGGNNLSGTISGSITVNVEEVGCRPIIIGELYGGGNLAAYSIYGYNDDDTPKTSGENPSKDPEINVKSFTSIGSIYGGGYGEPALMVGSPTVNINEVADPESEAQNKSYTEDAQTKYYSDYAGETKTIAGHSVILPSHEKGKMGSIYNVFGGGNAAMVQGNTTVNIGTTVGDDIYMEIPVKVGDTLPDDCYTKSGDEYTPASGEAAADTDYYKKYTVLGVDIRDNVYGGGNNAEVTGNANVNIGKKATP